MDLLESVIAFLREFTPAERQSESIFRDFATDIMESHIFSESAVKEFGEDFIKYRKFSMFGADNTALVIGVVEDFHFMLLHEEIQPVVLCVNPRFLDHISVRTRVENIPEVLGYMERVWKDYFPDRPFEYFFPDVKFDAMYKAEQRLEKIFSYFAVLAIFISCLGLFALASFMAEQRTKEIGIRKVFGASVSNLTFLLSKDCLKWILFANILAWPVAYIAMKKWLAGFAYRTAIGIKVFLLSRCTALVIAFLTISIQSLRAAVLDPINTLRYE